MKKANEITSKPYGKFDTADELLSAYNALEAQFTKRCQLVKELQAELERSVQAENRVDRNIPCNDFAADAENAETIGDDCADTENAGNGGAENAESAGVAAVGRLEALDKPDTEIQASTDGTRQIELAYNAVMNEIAEHAAVYAEALSAVPEIMDACVALYKQKRLSGVHLPPPHGTAALTPVKRPSTLAEAKILADTLLGL